MFSVRDYTHLWVIRFVPRLPDPAADYAPAWWSVTSDGHYTNDPRTRALYAFPQLPSNIDGTPQPMPPDGKWHLIPAGPGVPGYVVVTRLNNTSPYYLPTRTPAIRSSVREPRIENP